MLKIACTASVAGRGREGKGGEGGREEGGELSMLCVALFSPFHMHREHAFFLSHTNLFFFFVFFIFFF